MKVSISIDFIITSLAYWFAALSGRDIAIMNHSLIAEMCKILYCGFPLESQMLEAFPYLKKAQMEGAKAHQFTMHFTSMDEKHHLNSMITRADGFQLTRWYREIEDPRVLECITNITRCDPDDTHCHDRHSLQRLIRGPFKERLTAEEERRVVGVPANLKRAILSLPHALSPRLDAAFHLRCQFSHFEMSVGKDDGHMWDEFVAERDSWINSTASNGGQMVFKLMTLKLMSEIPMLRTKAIVEKKRARKRLLRYIDSEVVDLGTNDKVSDKYGGWFHDNVTSSERSQRRSLMETLLNTVDDKDESMIYVYVASDNEVVKEALTEYLMTHTNETVAVMRVKNNAEIAHAKNAAFFRSVGKGSGPFDLTLDWYALSLSNVIFAFRRNTMKLSTFAQSAQHMSGNTEKSDFKKAIGHGMGSVGLALAFKMEHKDWWDPVWQYFS